MLVMFIKSTLTRHCKPARTERYVRAGKQGGNCVQADEAICQKNRISQQKLLLRPFLFLILLFVYCKIVN